MATLYDFGDLNTGGTNALGPVMSLNDIFSPDAPLTSATTIEMLAGHASIVAAFTPALLNPEIYGAYNNLVAGTITLDPFRSSNQKYWLIGGPAIGIAYSDEALLGTDIEKLGDLSSGVQHDSFEDASNFKIVYGNVADVANTPEYGGDVAVTSYAFDPNLGDNAVAGEITIPANDYYPFGVVHKQDIHLYYKTPAIDSFNYEYAKTAFLFNLIRCFAGVNGYALGADKYEPNGQPFIVGGQYKEGSGGLEGDGGQAYYLPKYVFSNGEILSQTSDGFTLMTALQDLFLQKLSKNVYSDNVFKMKLPKSEMINRLPLLPNDKYQTGTHYVKVDPVYNFLLKNYENSIDPVPEEVLPNLYALSNVKSNNDEFLLKHAALHMVTPEDLLQSVIQASELGLNPTDAGWANVGTILANATLLDSMKKYFGLPNGWSGAETPVAAGAEPVADDPADLTKFQYLQNYASAINILSVNDSLTPFIEQASSKYSHICFTPEAIEELKAMEIHKYKSAFPMCTDISFNVDSNSEITQLFEEAGLFPHLIHTLLAQRFTAYDSNGFATLTTAPVGMISWRQYLS